MTALAAPSPHEIALTAATLRHARRHDFRRRSGIIVGRTLLVCLLLLLWDHASGRWLDRDVVSDPVSVVKALGRLFATGRVWPNLEQTLIELGAGYAFGAVAGLLLALIFALAPDARRVLRPYLTAFYSIPMVALAPLIIMWFGLGTQPKIILAATFVFFVVFTNAAAGIDSVSADHLNLARVMGASRGDLMRKILLPTTVPFVLIGLRLGIPEAMSGAIIGEFISSTRGLGYLVRSASEQFNMGVALAAIVILLVIVACADAALELVDRHLLRWRPQRSGRR
jgi:NitT/TauT family transport system permease protein